jgi:hypothetical protein
MRSLAPSSARFYGSHSAQDAVIPSREDGEGPHNNASDHTKEFRVIKCVCAGSFVCAQDDGHVGSAAANNSAICFGRTSDNSEI